MGRRRLSNSSGGQVSGVRLERVRSAGATKEKAKAERQSGLWAFLQLQQRRMHLSGRGIPLRTIRLASFKDDGV